MVLAIPAAAVLAGGVILVLANATWDGLVADDYYQRGMQINRSLARDAEAARLGLRAVVAFPTPGVVEVRLPELGGTAANSADRLNLRFSRAARAGADVRVSLTRDDRGIWRGGLPELTPGKWYVEIGNDAWRLAAPARLPAASGTIALRAGDPLSGEQ